MGTADIETRWDRQPTIRDDRPDDWRGKAACSDADTNIFFSPEGINYAATRNNNRRAQRICATCSVTQQCLDYAVRTRQFVGVWGGLTPVQRRQARLAKQQGYKDEE